MITTFVPDDSFRWPSGDYRDIAGLDLPPAALERQLGVRFEPGVDNLDYNRVLGLALPSGRRVILACHERSPSALTLIRADMMDEITSTRQEALYVLGLSESNVAWTPESGLRRL